MKIQEIQTPNNDLSVQIYNVNGTERVVLKDDKLYLENYFGLEFHQCFEQMLNKKLELIYTDPDPICPKCGEHITAKYDKGDRSINKVYPVKVTIYRCKCGGLYRTPLTNFVDKYCNYVHEVKKMGLTVNFFEHMSLVNITGLIKCLQGVTPSKQTIYNEIRKYYGKLKIKGKRNLSGNYAYDEQYIKLNGIKYYILALFDIELNVLVDYHISDNMEKKEIIRFIKNATHQQKRISLTTDGKPMYKKIADELGFIHNLCIFHIIKDVKKIVNDKMKNKMLDENQKTEYYDVGEILLKIFHSKSYKQANNRFKNLMKNLDKIPAEFIDLIKNKIKPNFQSYMKHLQFDFLPTTNNKMENYFGATLPRCLKKIFKTIESIEIYLDLQRVKWDQNHGKVISPIEFFT
jgi:transposase-like protein